MEENKLSFNELEDLIPKIKEAMNLSEEKQKNIDEKKKELREETRPVVVEEGKEEIAKLEEEKKEHDDMTKPSLNRAKLSIDNLKTEESKDFNDKLLSINEKRQEAKNKLDKMKQRAETEEDLEKYQAAYDKALEKIQKEEDIYTAYHEDTMNKLDSWDLYVVDTMLDLGMEIPTAQINSEQKQGEDVQDVVDQKEGEKAEGVEFPPAVSERQEVAQVQKDNLPIRSFWEIYNDTNTEHVGSVAHNLHKVAHMKVLPAKEEDTLQKVLSAPLAVFKLPMKLLAKIPNAIMGTDKKIDAMKENIENLSPEEFRILVENSGQVNEKFGKGVKDVLDRDYLDPQFMKQYKVGNGYLEAVRSRLGKENSPKIKVCNEYSKQIDDRLKELGDKESDLTPEEKNEYMILTAQKSALVSEGKRLQTQLREFDEGAKRKSSGYKNISGWFLAKFNPDNRKENAEMAELSKARREKIRAGGDKFEIDSITSQMEKYAKEQTELKGGKKNYIDIGAYSIQDYVEALDKGQQNKGRLLISDVAIVSSALGLANQIKENIVNAKTVETHNEQLNQANEANQSIEVSGTAKVSDAQGAEEAQRATAEYITGSTASRGEVANQIENRWGSNVDYEAYQTADDAGHSLSADVAEQVQNASTGEEALNVAASYAKSTNEAWKTSGVQDYIANYSKSYDAADLATNADLDAIVKFFNEGTIDYSTTISGTLVDLMPALEQGLDLNGVILAGVNAIYQAQKQKDENFRDKVKVQKEELQDEKDQNNEQEKEESQQQMLQEEQQENKDIKESQDNEQQEDDGVEK